MKRTFPNSASQVRYTADGFVEKNMESLSNELKDLGDTSSVELAKDAFRCEATGQDNSQQGGGSRRSSIRGFSVASQFKLSLQSLVGDLERTTPHYIRCIKPNLKKASNSFSAGEVLKQLRYSGMMEAIRIRREGYALREDHQSFYNRFSVLLGPDDMDGEAGIPQLVKVLSKRLNVSDADWQIGHSKSFLRRELSKKLERLAKLRVHAAARTLGRFGKSVVEHRLSSLLVTWVKFRLFMIKKRRAAGAASKISSGYRMNKQLKAFRATKLAIIKIQSLQRRRSAVKVAGKLRDPFCAMTYGDLKQLLKSEKTCMDIAVNEKDFRLAAEIEAKM
jgi:myosin heavy subunit